VAADRLTAPRDSVHRRDPRGRLTLGDCWREFVRRPSPPMIGAALALAALARARYGGPGRRDAAIAGGLVAVHPFTEWLIHVYLLHSRPVRVGGRTYDLPAAREHREHHAAPAELDGVLVPTHVLRVFLPLIAVVSWLLARGRGRDAASGALTAYAILAAYEWCHFLIHTPYVPRGRLYRAIRRAHRLHHYKNERYWFGVTSSVGDRVLGTFPEPGEVERSETARTLEPQGRA
jgi:hypothetical protein